MISLFQKHKVLCGALHGHAGEKSGAKELAKRNIKAFEDLNIDYIITNAGGCGAYLVDYDYLLKDDPDWAERAKQFVSKIKDITAILVELDFHKRTDLRLTCKLLRIKTLVIYAMLCAHLLNLVCY